MTTTIRFFRKKVQKTQVYQSLGKVQKEIINTRQNIEAIGKSLLVIEKEGVKHWEKISQNSLNNSEIIRELYVKSLTVNT